MKQPPPDPTPIRPVPDYDPNKERRMTEYQSGKKKINWWVVAIVALIAIIVGFGAFKACHAQTPRYWPAPIDSLARGRTPHTHVEARGQVVYTKAEDDGDLHIKLANPWNLTGAFVICECTLKEPCARPRTGSDIIVRGISRRDPEHGWWEIHPVEGWRYATAGE
jgi:hypothetical protein